MRRHVFALLVSLAALPTKTAAQQSDTLRDTARVAPLIVTASRMPVARARVSASVTVLDGDALRAQGLVRLADALRLAPGITVVEAGSFGAQTSLFTRGGQSNYTKVLVDGVPLNDPGGNLDIGTLTLDNVERVEIVRGPTSVVHGSDAVTGVVQIFTRRGGESTSGAVALRGGSYGSYDLSAETGGAVRTTRLSVGAAHHATDGIYGFNSGYRNDVGTATLAASPWRGTELRATGRYADINAHFPTDFTGAPVDPNAFRTEKRTMLGVDVRQRIGGAAATLVVGSNVAATSTVDPPNDATDFGSTLNNVIARQSADLGMVVPIAGVLTATLGGAVERQHQTAPDTGRLNTAAYVELLRSSGQITATAGARLDHSETYGDFGTYRLSLVHLLPAAFRVRGTIGTAFREPSFLESFDTPFSTANPSLRPERTTSWEAGIERSFASERLSVGTTYFQQQFVDLVDYRFSASGSRYENVARARASGVEVEARTAPMRGLSADASYTYLDTRVLERGFSASPLATLVEGGSLLRRPKHSGALGVAALAANGAMAVARVTYVGKREDRRFHGAPTFDTEAITLAAYAKVDMSGAVPLSLLARSLAPVTVTLRLDNLLAARYESVAGYSTPGRMVLVGLRAAF